MFMLVFNTWHSVCNLHFEKGVDTWWQALWGTWEHTLWVAGTSTLWQDLTWWSGSWSRCRSLTDQPSNERSGARHIISIKLHFSLPTVFSFCSSWQIGGSCSVWQTCKIAKIFFHNSRFTSMVQLSCHKHYHFRAMTVIVVSSKVCWPPFGSGYFN